MQMIDEPVEEDDTTGDVLLVRANEEVPTHTWDAVRYVQNQVRGHGTASGISYWGGERLAQEGAERQPENPPGEITEATETVVESISDRVQRQVSEALLVLDAIAEEIKAVGLSLVEAGRYLSDDDHDDMLHQATELATVRQEVRRVQNQVFQRKLQLNVRSEKVS